MATNRGLFPRNAAIRHNPASANGSPTNEFDWRGSHVCKQLAQIIIQNGQNPRLTGPPVVETSSNSNPEFLPATL